MAVFGNNSAAKQHYLARSIAGFAALFTALNSNKLASFHIKACIFIDLPLMMPLSTQRRSGIFLPPGLYTERPLDYITHGFTSYSGT